MLCASDAKTRLAARWSRPRTLGPPSSENDFPSYCPATPRKAGRVPVVPAAVGAKGTICGAYFDGSSWFRKTACEVFFREGRNARTMAASKRTTGIHSAPCGPHHGVLVDSFLSPLFELGAAAAVPQCSEATFASIPALFRPSSRGSTT